MPANQGRIIELQSNKTGTGPSGDSMTIGIELRVHQLVRNTLDALGETAVLTDDIVNATQASMEKCDWMWNDETQQFEWCSQTATGGWERHGTINPSSASVSTTANSVAVTMAATGPDGHRPVGTMQVSASIGDRVADSLVELCANRLNDPEAIRSSLREIATATYEFTFDDAANNFVCRPLATAQAVSAVNAPQVIVRDLSGIGVPNPD